MPAAVQSPAPATRSSTFLAASCRWLSLLVALPVLALSVLRALPAEWPVLAVQLVSFTPWLVVPATAAVVLALLGRRRGRGCLLLRCCCASFSGSFPWTSPVPPQAPLLLRLVPLVPWS